MQKEEWINNIMKVSADIKSTEPNPYLFNKIQLAIEQPIQKTSSGLVYKWAFAFVFIVALNITCITFISTSKKQQSNEAALSSLSEELELSTTYNY